MNYIYENMGDYVKNKIFIYKTDNTVKQYKMETKNKINVNDCNTNENLNDNTNEIFINILKKHTGVSEEFINEYYKFYKMCETKKYGINTNQVIAYLNITNAQAFYRRLRSNYKLNYDYIITKLNQKCLKGQQDTFYYISFDIFKKFV